LYVKATYVNKDIKRKINPLAKVFTSRLSALLGEIISSRTLHEPRLTTGSITSPLCGFCLKCAAVSWHVYDTTLSLLWDL
jgi:hypothetical protein